MKSLKQIRLDQSKTRKDILTSLGIGYAEQELIERGKQNPSEFTRRIFEQFYDCKINFLNVPSLARTSPKKTTWIKCEKQFRNLFKSIHGMKSKADKIILIETIKNHLNIALKDLTNKKLT